MYEWWLWAIVMARFLAVHSSWLKPVSVHWWQKFNSKARVWWSAGWLGRGCRGCGESTGCVSSHEHAQAPQGCTLTKISSSSLCTTPLSYIRLPLPTWGAKTHLALFWNDRESNPQAYSGYLRCPGTKTVMHAVIRMSAPALGWGKQEGASPGS